MRNAVLDGLKHQIEKMTIDKKPEAKTLLGDLQSFDYLYHKRELEEVDNIDTFFRTFAELGKTPLASDYLDILETHYDYDEVIDDSQVHVKRLQEEVNEIAKLVVERRPDLNEQEQLEIMDQLFEIRKESLNFQVKDRIIGLKYELEKYSPASWEHQKTWEEITYLENQLL